ncbi:MAG: 3-dehydroquinate synthase [Caulobacterales bacterium]
MTLATVPVAIAGRPYDVRIGRGLVEEAPEHILPLLTRRRLVVVMDETVRALHGDRLIEALRGGKIAVRTIVLPAGEGAKSFPGLEDLCDRLLALRLERTDLIVAFGGGVVGDLAGFAAAIYKRGIDFVQIPTTLLAQVDSSVGGKTAIDTGRGKNLIGAFHQPKLVLADLSVLDTLPDRELRCGYAEVLKYGLLGDIAFFEWLEANGAAALAKDDAALAQAIHRSVEMKAEIVAEDERETGRRALLNLGHTFAHALEAETGFDESLKHGEAVALGCALAFRLSAQMGRCPGQDAGRAERAIAAAGLPTRLSDLGRPFSAEALVRRMGQDKKTQGGALTLILATGLGEAHVAKGVEPAAIRGFLMNVGARP